MKMDRLLQMAGGRSGRLPGQGPLLRRPHDADQRARGLRLLRRLLQTPQDYHADMILCMCPMCQLNLDGYQARVNGYFNTSSACRMYFTQLLGISFGIDPKQLGFGKESVAAMPVLTAKLNGKLAEVKLQRVGWDE